MTLSKYQITQKIAQGGMAEVYCAVQSNAFGFERKVAIKKILPKHLRSPQHQSMLVTEAKLLVGLNHPNIVKVHDLGCMQGTFFLVMEYVDGCDLRRVMQWFYREKKRMPVDCAVMLTAEICKALHYAHQKRDSSGRPLHLVHLDVSPKNILLSKSGEVKLSDFGIASFSRREENFIDSEKNVPVVRGKYSYMSPEQALGGKIDGRSDIFSLGLVLYEMLTGSRFYQSSTLEQLQKEHRERLAQAPLFQEDIALELEYMILRCLAYKPEDRYAEAVQLYKDLLQFLYESMGTLPQYQLAFLMEEVLADIGKTDSPKSSIALLTKEGEAETLTAYKSPFAIPPATRPLGYA